MIAAWVGYKDASLTIKLYAHSQDDALGFGGGDLSDPVSNFLQIRHFAVREIVVLLKAGSPYCWSFSRILVRAHR